MAGEYAIETANLRKIYRSRFRGREIPAVSDLSLQVPQGSKFGLLGPNGAGKTTFVKMLLSAVHPTSGVACLFGRNAAEPEARRPVGYLPENHRFPTYLTGAGMLDFYGSLSGLNAGERRLRIPEMLKLVGLENWGEVRIKKYSKGMLQRLGLAQALIHRPRLLILDEPTDGVDPVGRRDIRDILHRLTGTGVTVFINSHLLSEVESFCEYVAILHRGTLALEGRVSALTASGGYSVVCAPLPSEATAKIKAAGAIHLSHPSGAEFHASGRDLANRIIDLVRDYNVEIESVSESGSSLEDVFIRVTSGKGSALPEEEAA